MSPLFAVVSFLYTSDRLFNSAVSLTPPIEKPKPFQDPKPQADEPTLEEELKPAEPAPEPVEPESKPAEQDAKQPEEAEKNKQSEDTEQNKQSQETTPAQKPTEKPNDSTQQPKPPELLAKTGYDAESGNDHLIFTGGLLTLGPDSAAVVDLAMSLGASSVRGIPEDRVLLVRELMNAPRNNGTNKIHGLGGDNEADDELEQEHLARGDYVERIVANSLTVEQIDWLADLPAILDIGNIPTVQSVYVSHAGLVPGLKPDVHDPWPAMNMRSIVYPREQVRWTTAKKLVEERLKKQEAESGKKKFIGRKAKDALILAAYQDSARPGDRDVMVPIDDYSGYEWAPVWNRMESEKSEAERQTIIYGRDTKYGLNLGKYTFGLNTRCVFGEQLTALVISGSSTGVQQKTISVDCSREQEPENTE
ncbi:unnamed protein product [Parascedosporium putredinis]|uniref:Uncharacterized protein n=1 Tax=Parascedosporium putredinis TaxID=1442378 RepID=A0A9P1M7N2_9PEZI|nr:unnamed protein product [Parascedosporium putredinis]CAI7987868.1 unnamed protein product [Parascedosporium putredinis]